MEIVFYQYPDKRFGSVTAVEIGEGAYEFAKRETSRLCGEVLKTVVLDRRRYSPAFLDLLNSLWKLKREVGVGDRSFPELLVEVFEAGRRHRGDELMAETNALR